MTTREPIVMEGKKDNSWSCKSWQRRGIYAFECELIVFEFSNKLDDFIAIRVELEDINGDAWAIGFDAVTEVLLNTGFVRTDPDRSSRTISDTTIRDNRFGLTIGAGEIAFLAGDAWVESLAI